MDCNGLIMGAMTETSDQDSLIRVLDWYRAMGVDGATAAEPVNWLERGSDAGNLIVRAPAPVQAPVGSSIADRAPVASPPIRALPVAPNPSPALASHRPLPPVGPSAAGMAAREAARHAKSLSELRIALERFEGCSLKSTAKNLCFFRGSETARLMLIGEAPGREEDLEGKPFVGRAGQLLDKMLGAIGLTETDVHITNIVYWRPPGNRTPTPQEAEACRPFLERHVELVAPDIVAVLGGVAAKAILNESEGIMKLRGRWHEMAIGTHKTRVIATLHPAYLLRTPASKRQAWRDFLTIRSAFPV